MPGKSLLITIVVLIALASLATVSVLHNWEIGAVAVALMGFTFLIYWKHRKEKLGIYTSLLKTNPAGGLG